MGRIEDREWTEANDYPNLAPIATGTPMVAVLITGANRGLGLEFARQYAEDGARIIATCREPARADALQRLAQAHPKLSVHALDVTDGGAIEALARATASEPLDILINNAGIIGSEGRAIDYGLWEELFRVNAIAPFRIAQAFREHLKKATTRKIVTITSGMGSTAGAGGGYYDYRSSKAAVNNIMHGLAQDWGRDGFIVVVVSPGWVATDMGGRSAPLKPGDSVSGMRKLIAGLTPADNGRYLDYRGNEIPW
jgi:NAD(P)-dependent dehydrogenase (short-subunit alcohol dehydrogenase family)